MEAASHLGTVLNGPPEGLGHVLSPYTLPQIAPGNHEPGAKKTVDSGEEADPEEAVDLELGDDPVEAAGPGRYLPPASDCRSVSVLLDDIGDLPCHPLRSPMLEASLEASF